MKTRTERRWRAIALLATGMVIGVVMLATPAGAHVGGTVGHLWKDHIKPKTDPRYANAVVGTDKAKDADKLDGIDSTDFLGRAWAVVRADGSVARSAGVSGSQSFGAGVYAVDFVQNALNCGVIATLGHPGTVQTAQGQVVANPNTPGNVIVRTADSAGTETPRDFTVALLC